MKILHVCKKYPDALGGDAVVVSQLQKQQQAAGHEVVIVTSNCDEIRNDPHIYKFGFKDTAARLDDITFRRLLSLVVLFFLMFRILRRERPDLIHTHSIDMAFFASFAARLYGIPIVHTFHIVTFYDQAHTALRRKTELWLAKNANLRWATAPNDYDVSQLRDAGLTQTVLLPNGVDISFWKALPRSAKNAENKVFTFLAIGRLEHQKGHEHLIRAASRLARRYEDKFLIIIAGEGSLKQALLELARSLGLEHRVVFTGRKTPEEVRALLARADAVVLPSLYETTPLTLLEAWAASVPTISTAVGILRDPSPYPLAEYTAAYVVPPKDEELLAGAMECCMTDAESRREVVANGDEEVKRYAWPTIAKVAETIYRRAT